MVESLSVKIQHSSFIIKRFPDRRFEPLCPLSPYAHQSLISINPHTPIPTQPPYPNPPFTSLHLTKLRTNIMTSTRRATVIHPTNATATRTKIQSRSQGRAGIDLGNIERAFQQVGVWVSDDADRSNSEGDGEEAGGGWQEHGGC